jgi:predicted GIY-YIG superfamily endonuclease
MYTVYILRSREHPDKTYVGCTKDLKSRLAAHNRGESCYTSRYAPWELTASIAFPDKSLAYDFEQYLKSGSGRAFTKRHFLREQE